MESGELTGVGGIFVKHLFEKGHLKKKKKHLKKGEDLGIKSQLWDSTNSILNVKSQH